MIQSILGFLRGEVYKTNQTSKKIHLSNGESYNSRLFHQNLNIIRQFVNSHINSDEFNKTVGEGYIALKAHYKATLADLDFKVRMAKINHDFQVKRFAELTECLPAYQLKGNKTKFPFGKYRGRTIGEIFEIDLLYVIWFIKKYQL